MNHLILNVFKESGVQHLLLNLILEFGYMAISSSKEKIKQVTIYSGWFKLKIELQFTKKNIDK